MSTTAAFRPRAKAPTEDADPVAREEARGAKEARRSRATPRVGDLERAERGRAAELLAAAFRDNPLNLAVIGASPQRRLRCNLHGMRALFATAFGRARLLAARPDGAGEPMGVLLAVPPHRFPLPAPSWGARLRCAAGQGLGVARRWARVYDALERVHPFELHWYLGVLGVEPAAQRKGAGSALLAAWLRGVVRDAQPAYLETDRAENVAFYGRAGFEVVREVDVLGARVWCMWRDARPSGG